MLLVAVAIVIFFCYFLWPEGGKKVIQDITDSASSAELDLQLSGMPANKGDHYEIWSKSPNGGEQPVGYFRVLDGGSLVTLAGDPLSALSLKDIPIAGSELLITLEQGESSVDKRSERVILNGVFKTTEAELSSPYSGLSGEQFAMLASPTKKTTKSVDGVWFAKDASSVSPGLSLPVLSKGMVYAGWVMNDKDSTYLVGTFSDPKKADAQSIYNGAKAGWSVPGEDFVTNAPKGTKFPLSLNDGKTNLIVSVEPDYRVSGKDFATSGPFLKILLTRIPYHQASVTAFKLDTPPKDTIPSGKATIVEKK
jgi:hypothetical protein